VIIKRRKKIRRSKSKVNVIANNRIFCQEMMVIDEVGNSLGILSKQVALQKSYQADLDLILVAEKAKPPVARIGDLSKYKYKLNQKLAESRKKSKKVETKEVRFTPFIGENDLNLKIKKIHNFLSKSNKVRLSMEFRGRSISKKEIGRAIFDKIIESTKEEAQIEILPKFVGKKMICQLMPSIKRKKND
jgi:translation initiation factor IF-3